mmetsp:Transcript_7637/g.21187  ORF Transcript_7637/g.21187 Transcript_7637/m.21187 type:complete len:215 (+) Transcript_7637:239-883(+)
MTAKQKRDTFSFMRASRTFCNAGDLNKIPATLATVSAGVRAVGSGVPAVIIPVVPVLVVGSVGTPSGAAMSGKFDRVLAAMEDDATGPASGVVPAAAAAGPTGGAVPTVAAGPASDVVPAVVVDGVASGAQPTTVPLHSVTNGPVTHRFGWHGTPMSRAGATTLVTRTQGSPTKPTRASVKLQHSSSASVWQPLSAGRRLAQQLMASNSSVGPS